LAGFFHAWLHTTVLEELELEDLQIKASFSSTFILQEERKMTLVISAADPKFTRGPRNRMFEKLGK